MGGRSGSERLTSDNQCRRGRLTGEHNMPQKLAGRVVAAKLLVTWTLRIQSYLPVGAYEQLLLPIKLAEIYICLSQFKTSCF